MALDSTPRRRFGVALGVVLTGAAAGLIGFAGVASAHTPKVSAACEGDTTTLHVNLTAYNGRQDNTVKVTDGDQVLEDKTFKNEYKKSFETSGAVDHVFRVVVVAWDGEKYGLDKTLRVEKCVTETTTTTTTTTTESSEPTTPPSETSSEPTETPSSSTEAPPVPTTSPTTTTTTAEVEEAALAETGASIGLPLGIAGVLLVGGGVLLFVVRRRSKA
jgi:LPXTG-motif cell wall-anchored protein